MLAIDGPESVVLAIVVLPVVGSAIVLRPLLGLAIIAFFVPIEDISVLAPGITLAKPVGLMLLGGLLLRKVSAQYLTFAIPRPVLILLAFTLVVTFSGFWSQDPDFTWHLAWNLILKVVFVVIIVGGIETRRDLIVIMIAYTLGTITGGIFGLWEFGFDPASRNAGFRSFGQNPVNYAYGTALGVFFLIALSGYIKNMTGRIILLVVCGALVGGALSSGGRAYIIGMLIAGLVFVAIVMLTKGKRMPIRKSWIGGLIAAVVVLFVTLQPTSILIRFSDVVVDRGSGRFDIWRINMITASENLSYGIGLGMAAQSFGVARDHAIFEHGLYIPPNVPGVWTPNPGGLDGRGILQVHNVYLQTLVGMGIIGLGLLLLFLQSVAMLLWRAYRNSEGLERSLGIVIVSAFIAMLVFGFTEPILFRKFFWLPIALAIVYPRIVSTSTAYVVGPSPRESRRSES